MGKGLNRLSARSVATATEQGYYADGGGLYLQVSKAGTKSWIYRYTKAGRTRDMGLGAVGTVGLVEARLAAAECRRLRHQGKDPIASRRAVLTAEAGVPTFQQATAIYIEDQRPSWTNPKHAVQWERTLKAYAYPVIGPKRVDVVATADALAILRPIWTTKTETATRVRQRCERILDAEAVKSHRTGENPFRWRGHLDALLPRPQAVTKPQHFPALPYQELPALMLQLRGQTHISARALEFTILTIARTAMTIAAELDEFNGPMTLWTVPPERMKGRRENRREHQVPIVAYVRELVQGIFRDQDQIYVFPGQRGGHLSDAAMLEYLDHMGYGHVTVHGFRSTFKDWAAERTDFSNEVSEAALAHTIKDKTEAAYRRGALLEKRRRLMESWARYCLGRKELKG